MMTYEITDFTGVFKINISRKPSAVHFNAFLLPEVSLPGSSISGEILLICASANYLLSEVAER